MPGELLTIKTARDGVISSTLTHLPKPFARSVAIEWIESGRPFTARRLLVFKGAIGFSSPRHRSCAACCFSVNGLSSRKFLLALCTNWWNLRYSLLPGTGRAITLFMEASHTRYTWLTDFPSSLLGGNEVTYQEGYTKTDKRNYEVAHLVSP